MRLNDPNFDELDSTNKTESTITGYKEFQRKRVRDKTSSNSDLKEDQKEVLEKSENKIEIIIVEKKRKNFITKKEYFARKKQAQNDSRNHSNEQTTINLPKRASPLNYFEIDKLPCESCFINSRNFIRKDEYNKKRKRRKQTETCHQNGQVNENPTKCVYNQIYN